MWLFWIRTAPTGPNSWPLRGELVFFSGVLITTLPSEITYKHDWLLMVDGDEDAPPKLVAEMKKVVESGNKEATIYRICGRIFSWENGSNTAAAILPGLAV